MIAVVNPVASAPTRTNKLTPRVENLEGKTAGFRIMWDSFQEFMDRVGELLERQYHPKAVYTLDRKWSASRPLSEVRDRTSAQREFEDWAKKVDYAILGLAA